LKILPVVFRFSAVAAFLVTSSLEGQQPPEPAPGTPAPAGTQSVAPQPALTNPNDATATPAGLYGPWSAEVFYWLTATHPHLRGGAAAADFENLDYPGHGNYTPGIMLSVPVSKSDMLSFSGFITKGHTSSIATDTLDLFGISYAPGEFLTQDYTIKNFKLSLQDLLYPFPRKDAQTWRLKTLWELQYASISTGINAPLAPTTDSSGNPVVNSVKGSRWVLYPTFGLAAEYHLTPNLEIEASGSGFGIPHHGVIADAEGSLGYRFGALELVVADRYYYFKTSTQNSEYFKTTMTGPYAALRLYPEKVSIPCPFCSHKAASAGAEIPAPPSSGPQTSTSGTSQSASTAPSSLDQGTFVRRVSGGATLSVLGLTLIPKRTSTVNTSVALVTSYTTDDASGRIGYGLMGQVALTDHFAVTVDGLLRHIGYTLSTTTTVTKNTVTNGVITPTSTSTGTHEDTRARLIDIPAVVRFYNLGRHTRGTRWFLEAGGAWRQAGSIRTSLSSTDGSGNVTCCTNTPAEPAHRNAKGAVAGFGVLFIDAFGIHVAPEVRYTRWMSPIFEELTTDTRRNEITAGFTISF